MSHVRAAHRPPDLHIDRFDCNPFNRLLCITSIDCIAIDHIDGVLEPVRDQVGTGTTQPPRASPSYCRGLVQGRSDVERGVEVTRGPVWRRPPGRAAFVLHQLIEHVIERIIESDRCLHEHLR